MFKPQQRREEFIGLLRVFRENNPSCVMEIGTAEGGSLFCFCKLAQDNAKIISADLPPLTRELFYREYFKYFTKRKQKLHLLKGDSHKNETLKKVKEVLNNDKINFLFINADHSYEGVKKDFEMYSPLVRPGGIIAFHDMATSGVKKFWDETKRQFNYKEILEENSSAGIGILYIPKSRS